MRAPRAWVVLAGLLCACASTGPTAVPAGAPDRRQLTEAQALAAIQEALTRAGALARRALPVRLQADGQVPLDLDVYFGEPPFGVEWVDAQERARYGALLPGGSPTSPLRIVAAVGPAGPIQVLVLDDRVYAYEGNALLVQRGAPGIEDAEQRVRRDVRDFVEYARDQGATL